MFLYLLTIHGLCINVQREEHLSLCRISNCVGKTINIIYLYTQGKEVNVVVVRLSVNVVIVHLTLDLLDKSKLHV